MNRNQDGRLIEIELVGKKVIRVDGFDMMPLQSLRRKVSKVIGHNGVRAGMYRCRNHMPVILVGQVDSRDQVVMPGNKGVASRGVHQDSRSLQLLSCQVGSIPQNASNPFLMDVISPPGTKQPRSRQLEQQIADRCRIQHAGIEYGREGGQSVAQTQPLALGRQLVQSCGSILVLFLFVRLEVVEPDATMRSDLSVPDGARGQ